MPRKKRRTKEEIFDDKCSEIIKKAQEEGRIPIECMKEIEVGDFMARAIIFKEV